MEIFRFIFDTAMELQGFLILLLVAVTNCEKFRYDNFKLYSIKVENEGQLKMMKEMEENSNGVRSNEF